MRKNRGILLIFSFVLMILLFSNMSVLAADLDLKVVAQNASRLGIWTILPPVIAIVLAFITKNVVISLALGVFSGSLLLHINGNNIFGAIFKAFLDLINRILGSLADPWNAGIILQCMVIGGLIAVISKMGGAKAVAESLAKKAKTPRSTQIITLILGILVFFDDYANALIVGPIMRPVADKMKISREKLSFIIDGTAAPIAGIAVISTWIGYEISLIKDAYAGIGQSVNAYGLFLSTIPYRFYNILILVFIFFIALMGRDFGPMLKAERRARITGKLLSDTAKPMVSEETTELEPAEGIKLSIWNAIIPIAILIFGAFAGFYYNGYQVIMGGKDQSLIQLLQNSPASFDALRETFSASDASIVLFQSAVLASIVAILMGASQKIFKVGEAIEVWVTGMKSLIITAVILLLAWSLSAVIKELGTATFLVSILSHSIPKFLLPSIIFIFGSIISFSTGSAYGTMGILMPLTIPLAYAISPESGYVVLSVSAVLTGAIFGDHCSPISDTTIMSSMGSACDHLDHTSTQIVYALTIAGCTIVFGYLPAGLGLPIYIVLPLAIAVVGVLVRFIGKRNDVEEENFQQNLEMDA